MLWIAFLPINLLAGALADYFSDSFIFSSKSDNFSAKGFSVFFLFKLLTNATTYIHLFKAKILMARSEKELWVGLKT